MLQKIRIVTLGENTSAAAGALGDPGLSVLVETDEGNFLLDTGADASTIHNADRLGIDLTRIDKVILSHGHTDHTGGLRDFLHRRRKDIEIIAHPDVFELKYSRRQGHRDTYVGIPFIREELESLGARFHLTRDPVQITENVLTTGEVPMLTDFEKVDNVLWGRDGLEWHPDKVMDDQSLILKTEFGLVVILGCAHRGIINHLRQTQKITGMKEIHTVIGGCHLRDATKERIDKTVTALIELSIKKLGVSHCTGMRPAFAMMQAFDERFFFNNAGTITKLPED